MASCEVICTTPVLLSTTKTYNVLLQYYSNVLLRTTTYYSRTAKYYSSTTLYYEVLHCTAKYFASTSLHYKVLLQFYSSTTPVLLCTTKYYGSVVRVASCHVIDVMSGHVSYYCIRAFQEVAWVTKLPSSRA